MSRLMSAIADRLIDGQVVLERVLELLLPVGVGAEGVARHGLARGVELEQLLGHVAHRLLDPGLGALPRRAAETIERRLRGAGVFLHQIEPLDRHEQLVLAGIAQLEELLHALSPTPICFSPTNAPMPWSTCTTRSPDLQIAQIGQKRLASPTAAARARAAPPRRRPPRRRSAGRASGRRKPRESGADGHQHRGVARIFGALHRNREHVVFLEQLDGPLGAARRCGHEQHRVARRRAAAGSRPPSRPRGPLSSTAGWQRMLRCELVGRRPRIAELRRAERDAIAAVSQSATISSAGVGDGAAGRGSPSGSTADDVLVTALNLLEQLRAFASTSSGSDTMIRACVRARQVVEQRGAAVRLRARRAAARSTI